MEASSSLMDVPAHAHIGSGSLVLDMYVAGVVFDIACV